MLGGAFGGGKSCADPSPDLTGAVSAILSDSVSREVSGSSVFGLNGVSESSLKILQFKYNSELSKRQIILNINYNSVCYII